MLIYTLSRLSHYGFELSNRELASLIWIFIITAFSLSKPNIRSALARVLKAAVVPKVAAVWVVYLIWILVFVVVADWLGIWRTELTKDTILWVVTAGVALLVGFPEAAEPGYFRRTVLEILSIVVILEYLVNLTSFPLLVEFLLQPIITILVIAPIVVEDSVQKKNWRKARDYFGIAYLLILLSITAHTLNTSSESVNIEFLVLQAVWPVLLGFWVMGLVFALAVVATYEEAFLRLRLHRRENRGLWKAKIGLLLALRFRLKLIHEAAKGGTLHVAEADSVREAYVAAKKFKNDFSTPK